MSGLDAPTDRVVKVADVWRGCLSEGKCLSQLSGQMSGQCSCPGFPLKCCFMTTWWASSVPVT